MIVVNLNKSYPEFAAALGQSGKKDPNEILMRDLRPPRIESSDPAAAPTRRCGRSTPPELAIEWATMLGTGQPGGPWKQGEARGSRFVDSASYRERYERPTTKGRDTASWKRLTGELGVLRHSPRQGRPLLARLPQPRTIR